MWPQAEGPWVSALLLLCSSPLVHRRPEQDMMPSSAINEVPAVTSGGLAYLPQAFLSWAPGRPS